MQVPRVIHQTFRDEEEIPRQWLEYRTSLLQMHPNWKYQFWDDERCAAFVNTNFPTFAATYQKMMQQERVQLFKYLLMYKEGGLFVDFDCECLKPLDPIAEWMENDGKKIVMCQTDKERIETAVVLSMPGHPFWIGLAQEIHQHPEKVPRWASVLRNVSAIGYLWTTGPYRLTEFHKEHIEWHKEIHVLPTKYFYPKTWFQRFRPTPHGHQWPKESYTVHHYANSWMSHSDHLVFDHITSRRTLAAIKGIGILLVLLIFVYGIIMTIAQRVRSSDKTEQAIRLLLGTPPAPRASITSPATAPTAIRPVSSLPVSPIR